MTRRQFFADWRPGRGSLRRVQLRDSVPVQPLAHGLFHLAINSRVPDLKRTFFRMARHYREKTARA